MLKKTLLIGLSLILFFSLAQLTAAKTNGHGPVDLSGELFGAPYRIRVPQNWNGTLLVYAHGYRDKADHPGEVDNRNADIAPSAELETFLLSQGFALAGSAYRDNGWAVEEGIKDLRNLTLYFRLRVRNPRRTILWGFSMGTVVTFASMERYSFLYDGALCGCAVGAGSPQSWDSAGDLMLAYDILFGSLPSWGTVGDVRDDLDFETEVFPKLFAEVNNPANFPKFEFIRLVGGTPGRGITPPPPPAFYPGWIFTDMFFATEARAELERRAGGPVTQNLNRNYNLTEEEKAYLVSLGVPAPIIDNWLVSLNAQRNISASFFQRLYLYKNAAYTGKIKNPVLTLHTLYDPLVTVSQEAEYRETVERARRTRYLYQAYTNGNGHCNFTGEQLITSINAINDWVKNRNKPTAATFPTALGFLPADFTPPRMNQP
ncbi:MAG: hypothetical protein R2747_16165 [Pyrinomonadaceae bacterium]